MKLYEVATAFVEINRMLEDGDIDAETANSTLAGIMPEFETKVKNISAMILNLQSDAKQLREAEDRIAKRRKSAEKSVAYWKEYLLKNMADCGIDHVQCEEFVTKLQNNPPKVFVEDVDELPKEFVTVKVTKTANKKLLKSFIDDGGEVNGVSLIQEVRLAFK